MSKAKVFVDDKGNSMLFPAYIYDEDEFVPSSLWTVGMKIRSATGLKMQDGWIEIDRAKFPHIKTRIGHSGFAHGSEEVYLFAGPEFNIVAGE